MHQWIIFIVCLGNQQSAIFCDSQPDPSGKGSADSCMSEGRLEAFKIRVILSHRLQELACWLFLADAVGLFQVGEGKQAVEGPAERESLLRFFVKSGSLLIGLDRASVLTEVFIFLEMHIL